MSCFIFDFDGTIADSYQVVIKKYNEICPKYGGRAIIDEEQDIIKNFAIPKILTMHGISVYKLPFLLREIRSMLSEECLPIIAGMPELLNQLKQQQHTLGIISSNSRHNILNSLKSHQLIDLFKFIHTGSNLFGKHLIIRKALSRYELHKEGVIYVGDEIRDIIAANKLDIKCLAVDWGYNSRKILTEYNPLAICSDPIEIANYATAPY